jgi:Predicted lipoprotein of unknown function (DUF2380)
LIVMLKKLFSGAENAAAKLPIDAPLPVKAPLPHVAAPHSPSVAKPPHVEASPTKKPQGLLAPKEPNVEVGAPKKAQVELAHPKEAPTTTPTDAAKVIEKNPNLIEGKPGSRRAPVGEGHAIVEVPEPGLPSGIGCELHSPQPYPKVPCPKGMGSMKREPFADDPDFHKSIKELEDVPGAKKESLKDLKEGNQGIEERNAQSAGMFNTDKHHVFPQEERPWFEHRGMKDTDSIDNFTVELDKAVHQAQHGGGDWKLARKQWSDEYNKLVMRELKASEAAKRIRLGDREILLTPEEVKATVFKIMDRRQIPQQFVKYSK